MWSHLLICLAFSYPAWSTVYEGLFLLVGGASCPSYLQCSRPFAPHRKSIYSYSTLHQLSTTKIFCTWERRTHSDSYLTIMTTARDEKNAR